MTSEPEVIEVSWQTEEDDPFLAELADALCRPITNISKASATTVFSIRKADLDLIKLVNLV